MESDDDDQGFANNGGEALQLDDDIQDSEGELYDDEDEEQEEAPPQ
jgi:hypothetical protein